MSRRTRLSHGLVLSALVACGSPAPPGEPPPAKTTATRPEVKDAAPPATPTPEVKDAAPALPSILPPDAGAPTATVPARPGATTIEIDRTAFKITLPDGHVLAPAELVGVVLTVRDEVNAWRKIRIERVQADPKDGEITLYDVSVQDPGTGAWGPLCGPGPDGLTLAMPLAGTWTADGRHEPATGAFNMTCTSGAIGKCVRFGYKPWAKTPDGGSLWDAHQACVRMVRGDYCGDGKAWTRDGMLINIDDPLGIQTLSEEPSMVLEAGWGPDGALCVHHPRVPENVTLAALEARCPERLRGRTGEACTAAAFHDAPQFRLRNHSVPPR